MTRLCSPWDYSQRDEYPADSFAQFLHPSPIDSKEMDDMLVQCNKNSVYVLNSSYRYRDFDMIELFGSPAGRALTVNNRTAAEMHSCSKTSSSANNIASSCSNSTSATQSHHPLCQQPLYHPLQNCGFNGTCSTVGTGLNHEAGSNSDLIRYQSTTHPQQQSLPHQTTNYSHSNRTSSKIAKIWKLFDEDRIRKGTSNSTGSTNNGSSGHSGSDIFSRCQSRRKPSPVQIEAKTTKDLYNEAAQLLGIKCTLSDSCRCIDCQSQYFDCDDFDSYSEYSDKSYDLEDNSIANQSYFAIDSSHSPQDDLTVVCQSDVHNMSTNQNPDLGAEIASNSNQQIERANAELVHDPHENNNGSNCLYSHELTLEQHSLGGDDIYSMVSEEMSRRRNNENTIELDLQAESVMPKFVGDYDRRSDGMFKLEENGNLIA
ncbi:uncharacterized protein LOC131694009 [Topomyia yanbarensis]|uniref:uncharacterized protein LOC131694009 n=1 Tax=Topomyia yanbarensis TaxID=2498891 RepID=UPI00273A7D49|nr:uncharacterized protein LOC131694009 [Topomyia yanbarensis]XP_058838332.1 uncharacterized protein LOC131694009 [Topomyia yanbarensis]